MNGRKASKGNYPSAVTGQSGSALVYILIAIALLAALTMAFMNPSSNQTTSQNTFKTTSEMQTQVDFVRSAIQECVLTYPGGDAGVISYASGLGTSRSHNYPLMPNEAYLNGCGGDPSIASVLVSDLRCPGNPGDNVCHSDMFGGATAKFLPPPPALFGPWKYYNGEDGIFIWSETTNTDAFIDTVLDKLDAGFSECEADVMKPTSGNFAMTKDMAAVICPDESKCFRVWMKINSATAQYTPGSVEKLAPCGEP